MKIQTLLIVLMLTLSGCLGLNDAGEEIDPDDKFPNDTAAFYDTDNDGLPDELDGPSTSNPPLIADSDDDNDGFPDSMELSCGTNPLLDTSFPDDLDGDFECDDQDFDIDGDGIFNSADAFPLDATATTDTDGDGMPDTVTGESTLTEDTDDDNDGWSDEVETECGSNSLVASLTPIDENGDGVCDSVSTDDDGDTYSDDEETLCGSDPLDALSIPSDLDGDSICDALDEDVDGDGVSNAQDMYPSDASKHEDVPGCIDENAFNHDIGSNLDDGSCFGPEEAHSMMSEFMESGTWHFTTEQQEEMDEGEFYLIQSLFVNDAENDTTLISQVVLDDSGEEMFSISLLAKDGIIELHQYADVYLEEEGQTITMDDAVLIHDQIMTSPFMEESETWYHCEQDVSSVWFCSSSYFFTVGEEISLFDCDDGSQIYISQVNDGMTDCANDEDEPKYDETEYSEFECDTGEYIYLSEVNDGSPDCPAGDDEPTYDPITQEETSNFECYDGSTIPLSWVNDGTYDCPYQADEPYYESEETSEFDCNDEVDTIALSWVNDGYEDCQDGSDESEYSDATGNADSATDTLHLFTCDDGTMILAEYANDDNNDCSDGSDEAQSTEATTYECKNGEVIDFSLVNDQSKDCTDGSDEQYDFQCENGNSIPLSYVNNGYSYCEDGSDEPEYEEGEELSMYDCADGSQVFLSTVNDGNDDCSDGTDENPTHLDYVELVYFSCEETDSEIPLSLVNNGEEDCQDGSDEAEYDSMGNEISEYYCEDPTTFDEEDETVINLSQVNDGTEDCAFSWDEWTYVSENWFGMERDNEEELNGDCQIDGEDFFVPWVFVNDGDDDCDNGDDEPSYDSSGMETSTMTCWSGDIIALSLANDGNNDCPDGDDEILYMYVVILEGQSSSGENWSCIIPFEYLNDGDGDCQGYADEPEYDNGEELTFFECDDGTQIYLSQANDGLADCANGEDEPTWEEVEYSEFECNTGDYIYLSKVNDGSPDCPAGDDEPTYDPITQEETSTYECSYDGSTIPLSQVSDGTYDCPYGEDEPYTEEEDTSEYECADGAYTVPTSYINDRYEDCDDGSDEPEYDLEEISVFTCNDGIEIPLSSVNDDFSDCSDGSDEPNNFECLDGSSLSWYWVNDGYEDCQDGSDESDIDYVGNYVCQDGNEIPMQNLRDEYADCNDGSDEIYFDDTFEECDWDIDDNMWACSGSPMPDGTWSWVIESDGSWAITLEQSYDTYLILITPEMTIKSVTNYFEDDDNSETYTAGLGGHVMSLNMELSDAAPPFMVYFEGIPISSGDDTFECDDGAFIAFSSINDGNEDCSEGEDEPQYEQNEISEWKCVTGEDDEWLWLSQVSDGTQNCLDNSDEDITALFECNDGSTITIEMVSDGTNDCANAEDEPTYEQGDQEVSEFDCYDGEEIIRLSWVNDGYADCEDGSDENLGEGHGHGMYGVSTLGFSSEMEIIEWNGGSLTDSTSADGMDLVLSMCDSFSHQFTDEYMLVSECGADVQRWSLADIFAGQVTGIEFYDTDESGTLTDGDMFEITEDLDNNLEWNAVRLAKGSAYADENPEVVLPGFTAALGIISMLGAALLVRKNE